MDNWRKIILEWLHINVGQFTWVEQLVFISIILLLVAIVDRVAKILLNKVLRKIVQKTKVTWDDVLLEDKVLDNFVAIIPAILLVVALPFAFVVFRQIGCFHLQDACSILFNRAEKQWCSVV